MQYFKNDKYIIPVVERLFRDSKKLPEYTGKISDAFLANSSKTGYLMMLSYTMMNVRAGRGIEAPKDISWGVDWLADDLKLSEVLEKTVKHGFSDHENRTITDNQQKIWEKYPEHIQRLILRLIIAGIEAKPWLLEAFDIDFLEKYFKKSKDKITPDELYSLASHPWEADTPNRKSFELIDTLDMKFLAYGTILYFTFVDAAIDEYSLAALKYIPGAKEMPQKPLILNTTMGKVCIYDKGNDEISENASLIIDIDGNDKYTGRKATPLSLQSPVGAIFDLGGNDVYDGGKGKAQLGCGLFGISAMYDLAGDDSYTCHTSGLSSACYGSAILKDFTGNDKYNTEYSNGQGAAHMGSAILIDLSGNDYYFCGTESQGFGSTLGVGSILDVRGNDEYKASDTARLSAPFGNLPISFAQGTAFGRRADFGDGHSLAGGIGFLVEGDGDDIYYGNIYSQGAGYWWALGFLEDRGGNDSYRCVWYSLGSAPHFALGSCVDLKGNDKYNIGNESTKCQYQACARDGSIGFFIDGEGNDEYFLRNRCAGAGDLNSIAVFWDRCGNDVYTSDQTESYPADPPMGSSAIYEKFGNFRDEMKTIGVFIDTAGTDTYSNTPRKDKKGANIQAGENKFWQHNTGSRFYSMGIDLNLYKTLGLDNKDDSKTNSNDKPSTSEIKLIKGGEIDEIDWHYNQDITNLEKKLIIIVVTEAKLTSKQIDKIKIIIINHLASDDAATKFLGSEELFNKWKKNGICKLIFSEKNENKYDDYSLYEFKITY